MQEKKKYEKPKFLVEMERKKRKQKEEMQRLARQKLRELKLSVREDAIGELERATRGPARKEKRDALPDGAEEVYDQEALLEQVLDLKKRLKRTRKSTQKAEQTIVLAEREHTSLLREMQTLALKK